MITLTRKSHSFFLKIFPLQHQAKSEVTTGTAPPLLVFHLSTSIKPRRKYPTSIQTMICREQNRAEIFPILQILYCSHYSPETVWCVMCIWNLSHKACWFPCIFLRCITMVARGEEVSGETQWILQSSAGESPDSSLVFTFNMVGALPRWVWQKQESPRYTQQSSPQSSKSGYKKWPLPLVKHQRKTNYMQNNSPGQQTMMGGRFWPIRAQCSVCPDQSQDRKPCRPLECEGISWFSLSQLPLVKT